MKSNFNKCLGWVLQHEGGYTNDAADPGGPTNFGITIHDYRKYIDANGTARDVKNMSLDDAKVIYRKRYWDAQDCDDLPSGVDYAVFDYGVNSGIGRSAKVLAKFKGLTPAKAVAAICDERLAFLKRLKTWPTFGKGWGRRVAEVRARGIKMAGEADTPLPPPPDVEPVPVPPPKPLVKSKTLWATIMAGLTTAGSAFVDALGDWRIWAAIIVLLLLAYVIWERNGKPDIRGLVR